MKTTEDVKTGKLYWGEMPLPEGAELLGTVTGETGETGALIRMARGNLVQGNAGAVRSLPNMEAKVKSSYYLEAEVDQEMRAEAVRLGLRYPSDFILFLWEQYKEAQGNESRR